MLSGLAVVSVFAYLSTAWLVPAVAVLALIVAVPAAGLPWWSTRSRAAGWAVRACPTRVGLVAGSLFVILLAACLIGGFTPHSVEKWAGHWVEVSGGEVIKPVSPSEARHIRSQHLRALLLAAGAFAGLGAVLAAGVENTPASEMPRRSGPSGQSSTASG